MPRSKPVRRAIGRRTKGSGRLPGLSRRATRSCTAGGAPASRRSAPSFTFIQISDVHVGNPENVPEHVRFVRSVELINDLSPSFVIDTGDIATHPVYRARKSYLAELAEYRTYVSGLGCPLYVIPGNHDIGYSRPHRTRWGGGQRWGYHKRLAESFEREIGPLDQCFDHGRYRFVLANNNPRRTKQPGSLSRAQLTWLHRLLKARRPTFLLFHVNLFWRGDGALWGRAAREIAVLCREYPVVLVAYGHSHDLKVRLYEGTLYIMAPDLKVPGHNSILQYRVYRERVEVWEWDVTSRRSGLVVSVETHRGMPPFSPPRVQAFGMPPARS